MSDPQWQNGDAEISYTTNTFYISSPVISLGSTKADYDTCRNTTGYRQDSFDTGTLTVGQYLCVKTGQKRYSALRITGLTAQQMSLDVVTYDPPGN